MGSSIGRLFRVTTFGESHGGGLGAVVDGCPPRLPLSAADIQRHLDRRRPGGEALSGTRTERDRVEILSGVHGGLTLGSPIALLLRNEDARPEDYEALRDVYRPSHADFTYEARFGLRDPRGGGRASARETAARVAAGAVAEAVLLHHGPIEIVAWVERVAGLRSEWPSSEVSVEAVYASPVRCPDPIAADAMAALIEEARREGDSVGGAIRVTVRGLPAGLGDPVFDRLDADLAKAVLSIPAATGFEVGSGFEGSYLRGSENNDPFTTDTSGRVHTTSNRSGGIQGGISNGAPLELRVAFKPTPSIARAQQSVTRDGHATTVSSHGRHDPCVLPRAVPVVEAMVRLVLADHLLRRPLPSSPASPTR